RSDDRATETASGRRRLDRAIYRHARAALAQRVPAFGFGLAQSPGRDFVQTHPGDRRRLASVAGLCADTSLERPWASAKTRLSRNVMSEDGQTDTSLA